MVRREGLLRADSRHLSRPPPRPRGRASTDGAIYDCALPRSGVFGGLLYMFWSATAPAGPDPRVLAQTAIASMNLRPISIGIVPEDRPGSVGLVGMPVWLWAASPDQHSVGADHAERVGVRRHGDGDREGPEGALADG